MSRKQPVPTRPGRKRPKQIFGAVSDPTPAAVQRQTQLDQPFTGKVTRLDRLATVRPKTVVVVLEPGAAPLAKKPGELLIPSWLPFRGGIDVLPVNTEQITLNVIINDLTTVDSHTIERVDLQLSVRLRESAIPGLVVDHGGDFGSILMREVQTGVESGVRAAVQMNREQDLRKQGLMRVLQDRWLPLSFHHGALDQQGFAVHEVQWPTSEQHLEKAAAVHSPGDSGRSAAEDTLPIPVIEQPREVRAAAAECPHLDLSVDARLRRLWLRHSAVELIGIAGASVKGQASVIAVSRGDVSTEERNRLRGEFADFFSDVRVRLIIVKAEPPAGQETQHPVADSYSRLVKSWFGQVDQSPSTVVAVKTQGEGDVLQIVLASPLASAGHPRHGLTAGEGPDVEALRYLLPHRRIEFVTARTQP